MTIHNNIQSENPQFSFLVETSAMPGISDSEDSALPVVVEPPFRSFEKDMSFFPDTCSDLRMTFHEYINSTLTIFSIYLNEIILEPQLPVGWT